MTQPVLVTGASGQLGTALARSGAEWTFRPVGRPSLDFDRPDAIPSLFKALAPRAVVNAAAYTAVDAAESDAAAAFRANRDGPALLARLCHDAGIPLIHISTDYVFDGTKGAPYCESDHASPLGVYGASKRAGEQQVLNVGGMSLVVRTSWVISPTGRNFVSTMLAASAKTDRLRVVADQRGRPTSARDLAAVIVGILGRIETGGWQNRYGGVFHAAGSGEASWHGLASAIFEEAALHGLAKPEIIPITTADWPTPARRPPDSRLDCSHLAEVFGLRLPHWRESLGRIVSEIIRAGTR